MKSPLSHPLQFVVFGSLIACLPAGAMEVDESFQVEVPGGTVHTLVVDAQGGILVGGEFSTVNGANVHSIVRLNSAGELDLTFSSGIDGAIFSIGNSGDGTIYVAGAAGASELAPNGTVLPFSETEPNGRVRALALTSDGKVLIAGSFWSQPDCFVARLNADGSRDATFKSGLNPNFSMEAGVEALAVLDDGKIVVGGNFNTVGGFSSLARLNPDGSVDPTFDGGHGAILYPKTIVPVAEGKILVGGIADSSGHGFIRRLNADGSVDGTFTEAVLNGAVETAAVDPSGAVLIGGAFGIVNGISREHLARLKSNGEVDIRWHISANNIVKTISLDEKGNVLVGGAFSEIGGKAQSGVARITADFSSFGFETLAVNESGVVHLTLSGEAGRTYVIESSTDLKSWSDFKTSTATAEGLAISESAREAGKHFFRARLER